MPQASHDGRTGFVVKIFHLDNESPPTARMLTAVFRNGLLDFKGEAPTFDIEPENL